MKFSSMRPKADDMPDILKQGAAVHTHHRDDRQGQQRYRHHHDPDGSGHGNQHQLGITDRQKKDYGLYGIAGIDHSAQQLARIGVVGRNGVNVAVFFFVHKNHLPISIPYHQTISSNHTAAQWIFPVATSISAVSFDGINIFSIGSNDNSHMIRISCSVPIEKYCIPRRNIGIISVCPLSMRLKPPHAAGSAS